ncbi:MAG: ATP synthase subunit I [Acidimicrobiales bacterium]
MTAGNDPAGQRLAGPSPASEVARDMVLRGLWLFPVGVTVGAVIDGFAGAVSVCYAIVLVLANFLLAAYLLAWAARISFALVASVALGGYVLRLGLIFAAVWVVKDASWVRIVPLGITIIVTHLGLLFWELRFVAASFAHPGLKPSSDGSRSAAGSR